MDVRTLLRAALVPVGLALAARGIEQLRTEADELHQLVDARRAYLAGDGPLPDVDEHQDDKQPPAPKDFPSDGPPANLETGKSSVRRGLVVGAVGLALGWATVEAWRTVARRSAVAAVVAAARSADLMSQPPAPGSPADLAARTPLIDLEALARYAERERQGDEFPHTDTARVGAAWDPFRCRDCQDWTAPAGLRDSRSLALTLHQQQHTTGLPGTR